MAAGDDRIVDTAATARWAAAAPRELVDYVRWNGLYHEIFNEFEKEEVFERMERWLEARLS
jgi:alpha-beta hydrolase superfamily lysophospholipase